MGVNGIYGLSGSGLDIESMVKVGMMSKQSEYDKMAQKYTKNEWTKTALVELNNQINTFNMSTLINYKLSSNTNARTASSTNEAAVTATATAKALAMPHRVDVEELSSNAYLISKNTLSNIIKDNGYKNVDTSTAPTLKNLFFGSSTTDSPTVTSDYNTSQTFNSLSDMSSVTYDKDHSSLNLVTSTTVTRGNDGKINGITYNDGYSGTTTLTSLSVSTSATTTATFGSDTKATLTQSDNDYTLNVGDSSYSNGTTTTYGDGRVDFSQTTTSSNSTDGSTTTKTVESKTDSNWKTNITITNTTTYDSSTEGTSFSTTDNGNGTKTITFTKTNDNGATLGTTTATLTSTTNITTDPSNPVTTYTLTIGNQSYAGTDGKNFTATATNTDGSTTTSTVTLTGDGTGNNFTKLEVKDETKYTDGSTTIHKEETVNGTNSTGGDLKVIVTSDTAEDGKVTTTAKTTSVESGYFGKTTAQKNENGTTAQGNSSISSGFTKGTSTNLVRNGSSNAISFSISDGVTKDADGNLKTIDIAYSFDDIYKDKTVDGETKQLTITDLVSDINTQAKEKGLNITATYEFLSDRFFLYNSESGADNKIIITANDESIPDSGYNAGTLAKDFFNVLGFSQSKDGGLTTIDSSNATISGYGDSNALIAAGSYAKARVDGVLYDKIENNKLEIEALGITYDLHNVTSTKNADGSIQADNPVTVTIGQDVEKIVDNVKSFVENYNKILSSLYEKYDEKPESGYTPLTQSQKDQMKDEQVEKWEEKAKKGLLYHDSTLSKIISDMRNAITASVEVDDKKYSVFSIGIGTTGLKGQLTLDEDKLRKAISEDSEAVYNTLSKLTMTTDRTGKEVTDYEKSGVAQRLGDVFTNATKLLKSRAGSSNDITEDSDLNNLLRELQTKMSNFKKMMSAFEDKLYKKYDAMEVALSKLGMQLNFITGGQ